MINTGSPNPEIKPKKLGWGPIAIAFILVLLAIMIGVQILGVLYGVLFPPGPPVLESFSTSSHTSPNYGVDDWLYISTDDACRVVRFYESMGADCRVAPTSCDAGFVEVEAPRIGMNVARCTGEIAWSIFQQRYYVNIAAGYGEEAPTRVRLEREIFWTGELPRARSESNFGTAPTPTP